MIKKLLHAIQYIKFYLSASNSKGHGTHSPLVYHFITEILNDTRNFYAYQDIDIVKKQLLSDNRKLNFLGKETSVASFMKEAIPTKYNKLLFRMVAYYKPNYIIEVGSSLGITTAYLASPEKRNLVQTIETNLELGVIASETLSSLALPNTTQSKGSLKEVVSKLSERTFGFILINHANWESEELAQHLLDFVEEDAIVIFVEINKNLQTKLFWDNLIYQQNKTISVTLFYFGIIFLKKEVLKKQQFTIRF